MLKDRGYIISEKKLNESKEEFKNKFNGIRESLNLMVEKRKEKDDDSGEQQKLIVFFPDTEKLNVQYLQQIALKMLEISCVNAIVIIKGTTLIAKKVRQFNI